MAFVCDDKSSPEEEKSLGGQEPQDTQENQESQENPDLEDGEIEDDDDDEEMPPQQPPEPEKPPENKAEILPAAVPTDTNLFSADKNDKSKRHGGSADAKKGKGHLTEAEKCVRMLHKLEREARERRERERRREQLSDDWAGNVEKAIANALKKPDKSGSDGDEEEEKKRGRKRRKKERDRKKKHRKTADASPKEEIDENEMLNVRGASPENKEAASPFNEPGDAAETYESYDSEYESDTYVRQNKRSFERERKRERNNRSREQLRRERKNFREKNNRKKKEQQNRDKEQQDANSLCMFYMQGKCHKDDCPYSHDALPPMKLELCKFYLMECCAKRDKCLYMHSEFPCKYYHTGLKCLAKENCKFAHGKPLSDSLKQVLLKHLETAPKEILGEFPRLSREGAQHMVNQTQHNLELQFGIKPSPAPADKANIPSLFDITVPMPLELMQTENQADADKTKNEPLPLQPPPQQKEKKVRQTRWNDGPPVPVAAIPLMMNPAFVAPVQNIFPQLNVQDQQKLQEYQMNYQIKGFYSEQDQDMRINSNGDVDMRTLQPPPVQIPPPQVNFEQYCQDAKLTSTLAPQVPPPVPDALVIKEEKQEKDELANKHDVDIRQLTVPPPEIQEIPQPEVVDLPPNTVTPKVEDLPNLPKKQRELFLRIQAQQKENPPENDDKCEAPAANDDDWYSSDDENDPLAKMVIHLEDEDNPIRTEDDDDKPDDADVFAPPQILIKPVEVFDKLGDLSKIDISDEVTKLLQTMQGQGQSTAAPAGKTEVKKSRDPRQKQPEITSPKSSGGSADPRQSAKSAGQPGTSQVMSPRPERRLSSSQRITIYEQGIIHLEEKKSILQQAEKLGLSSPKGDVDLRSFPPEDLDLRQNYGDTDLRHQSGRQDVDLRQLGIPFKGMQNYTPATEIDASVASHSPISYKVHVCDIPRPDYTGLRLSPKDAELSADPRLKKIFRVDKEVQPQPQPQSQLQSPASPKATDSPKPPRQDPRRRAAAAAAATTGEDKPPPVVDSQLTYNQQLQLLQNSAFYQSLTSNQKLMLNQEIASKGDREQSAHDPVLGGILSSLGLIAPSALNAAPALHILNSVNNMAPPLIAPPNIPPPNLLHHPPTLMGPNLGPGLLGAAPEFPINFDPRNGGLLGPAPPFQQNFNEPNFQYGGGQPADAPGGNRNFRPERGFRGDRGGGGGGGGNNRRGGARNWNRNNNNHRNMRNNRTNRSYTPP